MVTKTAKPKAATKAAAKPADEVKASPAVVDDRPPGNSVGPERILMDIACDLIDVIPDLNPRKTFDPDDQKRLAASIASKTQLAPAGVRPSRSKPGRYDLMFGERRLRAIRDELKLPKIWCRVINADDELQAALTDDENATQRPLNPIEAAESLSLRLRASGLSQTAFAQLTGASQGNVSNTLRLLELPEPIRQLVISGKIAPAYARAVIPFMDIPEVEKAICADLSTAARGLEPDASLGMNHVRACLIDVCRRCGREVNGYYWDAEKKKNFQIQLGEDLSPEVKKRLNIRECPTYSVGQTEIRAFDIPAWVEAQAQWEREDQARREAEPDDDAGADDGDNSQGAGESVYVDRRTPEQKEKEYQRDLRSYVMQWHQRIIAKWLPDVELQFRNRLLLHFCISPAYERCDESLLKEVLEPYDVELKPDPLSEDPDLLYSLSECSEGKVNDIGLSLLRRWVQAEVDGYGSEGLTPWTLSMMIAELGIELPVHWTPDIEFLAIHTDEQLVELAKEWKLKKPPTDDRQKLVAYILDQAGLKPPARLLAVEILPKSSQPNNE